MITIPGYQIKERPERGRNAASPLYESRYSVVYQGIRQSDDQPVILKLLKQGNADLNAVARFRSEYEMTRTVGLNSLQREGIIEVYGLESHQNQWVMVMEDFGAESLAESLAELLAKSIENHEENHHKGWPLQQFLRIAIRITEILGGLHQQNIMHKDINPSNILYHSQTGQIKLIDFGIATSLSRETSSGLPPTILEGTLAYMSPEQTGRMNRAMDYRTDLYSLGTTFYELLTGQPPFQAEEAMELVHCHLAKQPIPPHQLNDTIPVILSEIVLKLMAKHAEDRYQNTFGLKADLETCLAQLNTTETIESFPLGEHDISDRFQIPQKLYGREKEIETLLSAFDRVSQGAKEMVVVTGYAGIGKSALVHEIHKQIVKKKGYFISGKFDQFKRDVPFACLIDAFQGLIRQLLSESENQVAVWKQKLLEALGVNGRVIIEVIPEVELIVGPQPLLADLPGAESQNRFNYVFQNFIRALSTPECPLTIFLDDLQWADPASLHLLELFMSDSETDGLFFIGAYRRDGTLMREILDNEMEGALLGAGHVLISTLRAIRESGAALHSIHLPPLPLEEVHQLIADTFQCSLEATQELADVCFEKTQGNPFFLSQFLHSLYTDGLVKFSTEGRPTDQQSWQWRMDAIHQANITDNVVELMTGKIQKLPQPTQQILQWAACLGNSFELKTLALIHEQSPEETVALLWVALQEGLILGGPASRWSDSPAASGFDHHTDNALITFKFSHDRIQEAAYSLIEKTERASIHLKIGRLLLEHTSEEELGENPFDLVNHWNQAQHLIDTDLERRRLAELNLIAGVKAKKTLAYSAAVTYLKAGSTLLEADRSRWPQSQEQCSGGTAISIPATDHSFFFTLHLELATALYLNTDYQAADQLYSLLLENARSDEDRQAVYMIQLQQLAVEGKHEEVIEVATDALTSLGVRVPLSESEAAEAFEKELAAFPTYLAGRKISDLAQEMIRSSPEEERQLRLLSSISTTAYILSKKQLDKWTNIKRASICLQYGNNEIAPNSYVSYAYNVLATHSNDYHQAHEFGRMAVELAEHCVNSSNKGRTQFIFASGINHWLNPLTECLPYFKQAIEYCIEGGDLMFARYAIGFQLICQIICGRNLIKVWQEAEGYISFIEHTNQGAFDGILFPTVLQSLAQLSGTTTMSHFFIGKPFDEKKFLKGHIPPNFLAQYYGSKIRNLYLLGHYHEILEHLDKPEFVEKSAEAQPIVPETYFYTSLALTALSRERTNLQYQPILETHQTKMKVWAENGPSNYEHKYLLVEAERARLMGKVSEAMQLYKQGIASATKYDFLKMEALGNELYAWFWLENDEVEFAKIYLLEAHRLYQQWGAIVKVRQLEENYPQLIPTLQSGGGVHQNGRYAGADPSIWPSTGTELTYSRTTERSSTSKTILGPVHRSGDSRAVDTLDLDAIIKASQALSEEINPEKLLGHLMRIIIENAGAQKGLLLLKKDDTFLIEGSIDANKSGVSIQQETPQEWQLPLSIIRFVTRTGQSMRIDRASEWQDFLQDPYFTNTHPQSILCIPMKKKEQIEGVLYLENEIMSGVFTEDRIQMLESLLSQAAISLENSRLFTSLEEQKEAFRTLVENVNVGIYRSSGEEQGTFLQANPAMAQILGYASSKELMKIPVSQFYARPEKRQEYIDQLQHQREFKNEELHLKKKDGTLIWVSMSASAKYDEEGRIKWTDGVLEDITERKKAEEILKKYHKQLEQEVAERTEKLKESNTHLQQEIADRQQAEEDLRKAKEEAESANRAKSEFLANMSHELRTPMNSVLGFTELLETMVTDKKQKGYLQSIKLGGKSLLTLINDILDLSKIEAGKIELQYRPTSLKRLFQEIQAIFSLSISQKGLAFAQEIDPQLPQTLLLDETRLRQVLFNLVGNAVKFTEKGKIRLSVKREAVYEEGRKQDLLIVVEDSGIGIPEKNQERIFESFQQQEGQDTRKYGGTGLGLTISKRLVEAMNGSLTVSSKVRTVGSTADDPAVRPLRSLRRTGRSGAASDGRLSNVLAQPGGSVFKIQLCQVVVSTSEEAIGPEESQPIPLEAEQTISEPLSAKALSQIPEILKKLEVDFMPQWESLQKKQPIKRVAHFGTELKNLGERSDFSSLVQFGEQLLDHLDHLDIAGIKNTLSQFPELVQQIKSIEMESSN